MKKINKRLFCCFFAMCMLTIIMPLRTFAAQVDNNSLTRAKWLSDLVKTFEMKVEDNNYPDNYFSDLESSSEYYYDVLVAVQFGVVNIEAGDPIYPNQPVTREFAASTLNYCLGYQLDQQAVYTFSDIADVQDKDSAQIALNRNWFSLVAGKFCPQREVDSAEEINMLKDAKEVWESTKVDPNYDNTYTLANGIIEIPDDTNVYLLDDGKIYIENCPKAISVGDSFAVQLNGIPCVYKAKDIQKDNSDYIIEVSELEHSEAYKDIDMQGTMDASVLQIGEVSDGLKVEYSEKTEDSSPQSKARGSINLDKSTSLKVSGQVSVGDGQTISVDMKVKNARIDYGISLTGETFVKLKGNTDLSCSMEFDGAKAIGLEFPLVPAQVPGIGGIDLNFEVSFGGKFNVKTTGYLTTGVSYSKANGFRVIKGFETKSFNCTCEANASAGLKVRLGIYGELLPINGYVYTKAGGKVVLKQTQYESGSPKRCDTFVAYIYASTGATVTIKLGSLKGSYDRESEIYGEDNSPLRVYHHYEDGKEVAKCSRGTDFKYYTNVNSRYWGNGWTNGIGEYGYDADGNRVELYTYTLDENNNAKVTGYKGNAANLYIPETIDGYTVTGIADGVFRNKNYLVSVTIPDTVTYIGKHCFEGCTELSEVKLSDSLETLESAAFGSCTSLTTITIPKSVTTAGQEYGFGQYNYGPFYNCKNLKTVVLEEGRKEIPAELFAKCYGLENIEIPEGVTKIKANAFFECSFLKTINIPDTVTYIGEHCFEGCTELSEVELSNSLETLESAAFGNCPSLTTITIPKSVTTAGQEYGFGQYNYGPFYNCQNLKTVILEEGLKEIPAELFAKCYGLENIEIPEGVTKIKANAFFECSFLKTINIPDTVTYIGEHCFEGCTELSEVELSNSLETLESAAFGNCPSLTTITIPKSVTTAGQEYGFGQYNYGPFYNCQNLKTVILEEGLKEIPAELFAKCYGLENIEIPESVTKIKDNTFFECSSLKVINIPETITDIGNSAFQGCTSLKQIKLPNSIKELGTSVFSNCNALTEVTLDDTRQNITAYMFQNCTSLEKIILPDSVINIENCAFQGCTSLKEIDFGTGLQRIKRYAFERCSALEEVLLPDNVITIEDGVFSTCTSLKKVELKNSVISLGWRSFYNCDSLTDIQIPDSVTSLGGQIFYDCDLLKNVTLGTGITKIPEAAFEDCDVLEKIVLLYRVKEIEKNAFKNSVAFKEITIPRTTTNIDSTAFSYPKKTTIYGVPGTYAETFAKENGITFVSNEVKATDVKLSKDELTILKGQKKQLSADIKPLNFTDEVIWKSSDKDIVTVDDNGTVEAKGTGTVSIKLTIGDVSASCKVTVVQPVTWIFLNRSSLTLEALDTYQLTADVSPSNANNKEIKWSSSDQQVADVDSNGKVTAYKKGVATITASTTDGSNITRECRVTVSNTAFIVSSAEQLESGHNYGINCSDYWVYTDSSMDADAMLQVTFDERTEMEDGFDYLYIYSANGDQIGKYTGKELAGKVVEIPGNTIKIKLVSDEAGTAWGFKVVNIQSTVNKRKSILSGTESYEKTYGDKNFKLDTVLEAGNGEITYSSENEDVAEVDDTGIVSIKNAGMTVIKAAVSETDEYRYAEKNITLMVKKAEQNLSVTYPSNNIEVGKSIQIDVKNQMGLVRYTSSDDSIATVDSDGLVTGVSVGTVRITIYASETENYNKAIQRIYFNVSGNDSDWNCDIMGHAGGKATCTQRAICSICGQEYGELDPTNHKFTNYISDNNATTKADGTKTAYCDYGCGTKDTIPDPGSKKKEQKLGQTTLKKVAGVKVASKAKGRVNVSWKRVTGAKGYQIQYSQKKNFVGAKTMKISGGKKLKAIVKKLKSKKTYYFRVRAIAGKTTGKWSAVKKVKKVK